MRKWIFIFFTLFLGYQSLDAQDMVGCTQLLEDAREAYAAGMVELVPELLTPCLESDEFSGIPRQEAYKLVINAYLFDYLPEEADSLMDDFVDEFPDYRAESSDPAEFALLLNAHLRANGIDPDKALVEEEEITPDEGGTTQEQIRYKQPFDYGSSLGFLFGVNGTFPQLVEKYSVGNPALDDGSFGSSAGFQAGAALNLLLGDHTEVSFGLLFNITKFSYTASPLSFTTYVYDESQSHLQLPVSMIFKLNPNSKRVSVYMKIGVVADYLLAASGSGTRSYDQSLRDVTVDKIDITDSRARVSLLGMAGLGIRIPFDRAFMFLEAGYTAGIFMVNRSEDRYYSEDLTWLLYHVDSDFRINQMSFSAGMAWNL